MNKNHSQKPSDQQIDRLIQTVLQSTIITDEEIDEIAESRQLRQNVLDSISEEKSRQEKRWFFGWHWQAATAGAFLFLFVAGAAIWFSNSPQTETAATMPDEKINSISEDKLVSSEIKPERLVYYAKRRQRGSRAKLGNKRRCANSGGECSVRLGQ